MKVVHPQVLFRGGSNPFGVIIGNDTLERRLAWRDLRVLERMVIMERCILTMFITKGVRHHNSLSVPRALLLRCFSRCGCAANAFATAPQTSSIDGFAWADL